MKILYFAWMRGKTGIGEEDVTPPAEVTDVAGLVAWLKTRGPGFEDAFQNMEVVRAAVNQEFVELDAPVKAGDEVAFFPPVTGG
ncbi:molybdopterin converting factor subunit 1 [Nisaea sediminum]|uniref:molybdopterin converting factor subunit 1 n=1 Tax=Nisaea sediminum TaxID=2775867 RepID=UPI0018673C82|nr:molybdopterin converting factor subunit 1 [Nisaea sediminum]